MIHYPLRIMIQPSFNELLFLRIVKQYNNKIVLLLEERKINNRNLMNTNEQSSILFKVQDGSIYEAINTNGYNLPEGQ
jgi:hypothetical protein